MEACSWTVAWKAEEGFVHYHEIPVPLIENSHNLPRQLKTSNTASQHLGSADFSMSFGGDSNSVTIAGSVLRNGLQRQIFEKRRLEYCGHGESHLWSQFLRG